MCDAATLVQAGNHSVDIDGCFGELLDGFTGSVTGSPSSSPRSSM
jgi:hypothetical protein